MKKWHKIKNPPYIYVKWKNEIYSEVNLMEREQTTIRIPIELKKQIQQQADKEGQSFNSEIIILLRKGLGLK